MATPAITFTNWKPNADPTFGEDLLLAEEGISINGLSLHVEAWRIDEDPVTHEQRAANPFMRRDFDDIYSALIYDGGLETTIINDKEYVIFAYAYRA
jgi:hypothetical protein